ncbi:Membrane-bound lytic murein transglycosylase D precursor [Delftia tsuruhatensis]|uniref:lytic transglycosylase domain-containing protein n=1 Tax=Delftia tsuruhatensis TaxID=180282 RepID=UPI001E7E222B|nr:lytic transglycosylase domain-containing protein [Delftia tsuruhatensis]CAB5658470.1 Membrane-bound lytic murein transglycosylase D precursor [Delftia tsuruhatensis]CAC9679438.1 Membrane-bound lytic murein transglycosylase D precursor [Delftia tsuruhatensis]
MQPYRAATIRRPGVLAALAVAGVLCALGRPAHADLWAFVDERGITHFAAEALDERYRLYFRGAVYDSSEQGLRPPMVAAEAAADDAGSGDAGRRLQAHTRLQSFFDISPRYKSVRVHLRKASEHTGVDYDLLKAVIAVESGFDAQAVSPKGAVGLMQLMPATAQRFGVEASRQRSVQQQLADPAVNVPAGARYLNHLMGLFPGRLDLVLAAYNAGEGAVRRAGQAIPPFQETRNYVKAVLGIYEQLQGGRQRAGMAVPAVAVPPGATPRLRMTLPTGLPTPQ